MAPTGVSLHLSARIVACSRWTKLKTGMKSFQMKAQECCWFVGKFQIQNVFLLQLQTLFKENVICQMWRVCFTVLSQALVKPSLVAQLGYKMRYLNLAAICELGL